MGGVAAGGGYSVAHGQLAGAVRAAWPESRGLARALAATAALALGADFFVSRQSRRTGPSDGDFEREMAEWWRKQADEMEGRGATSVAAASAQQAQAITVNIGVPAPPPAAPYSRYLAEEGATTDTDCFSCATAHLAGMEGALRRAARVAERVGTCDDECQRWLHLAAQEPAALFARDWTPDKHQRLPPEQRAVVDSFEPRIRDLQRGLLTGAPAVEQREALVDGSVLLKESTRFTAAGDGLDHPEVQPRLADAVSALVASERLEVGVFDDDLATRLRRVRQAASRPESPRQLVETARAADGVSLDANRPAFSAKSPQDLRNMADQVRAVRDDFNAARRQHGDPASAPLAMVGPVHPPRSRPGDVHVSRRVVDHFTLPGETVVRETTSRENTARAYDHLEDQVQERGTRIRYRNLPSTFDETLFGQYDGDTDTMLLDAFTRTAKDSFSFQILSHESAHALVDGPKCRHRNYEPGVSYAEQPMEVVAQTASLAAMLELGMPVELADGTDLPPGARQIDWPRVETALGADVARDTRWAADWMVRAARGEDGALATESCPAVR